MFEEDIDNAPSALPLCPCRASKSASKSIWPISASHRGVSPCKLNTWRLPWPLACGLKGRPGGHENGMAYLRVPYSGEASLRAVDACKGGTALNCNHTPVCFGSQA